MSRIRKASPEDYLKDSSNIQWDPIVDAKSNTVTGIGTNSWTRDPTFYLFDGDCGIKLGTVMFKVHRIILEKSRLIERLFRLVDQKKEQSQPSSSKFIDLNCFVTHPPTPSSTSAAVTEHLHQSGPQVELKHEPEATSQPRSRPGFHREFGERWGSRERSSDLEGTEYKDSLNWDSSDFRNVNTSRRNRFGGNTRTKNPSSNPGLDPNMLSRYKIGIRYSESEYGFPVLEVLRGRRLRVNEKAARARAKEEEAMDVDEVKDEIEMEDIPMEDEAEDDGNEAIEDLEQFRAWLWAVYFRDEFRSETSSSYQGERDMCRLARVALMAWRLDCISWQFSLVPRLVRFAVEPNPRLSQTTHTDTQIQSQTTQTTYISDCSLRFFPYLIDVLVLYQCYEYGFGVEQTRKKVEDKWVTRSFDLDEERGKEEDWGQEEKEHMKVIRYAEERGLKRLICEVLYEFVVRSSEIPSSGQLGALEIPKELALIPGYEENILRGVEALKIFWDWVCTTLPSMFAGNPSSSCPFHDHRKRCVPALTRYWISAIDSVTRADEDSVLGKLGRKTSLERVRAYGNMVDVRMRLVKIWGSMAGYSREEERMKWVERQLRKDALVWEIKQGCSKQRRHELIAEVNIRRVKGARKECWDKGVEKIVEQFNALHDGWRLETFFFKDLEITKQVFATGEAKRNRSIQPAKYRIVMPGEEVRRLDQL